MDAEKTYSKLAILTTITATLTSTVAAQLSGNSQIPGTGFSISDVINLLLFWDLGSGAGFWVGLVMFLAVWFGFFFASKPFLQQLFDAMLDVFPSSDSRRNVSRTDEGEIKGVNMLALTSAFVTTQIIGQFFGLIPLLVIGFIPAIMAAWAMYSSQGNFREAFQSTLSNDEDTGASSSEIEELQGELNSVQDEIADLKDKEDETENEESEGQNPSTLADEIGVEVSELEDTIGKLENIESNFEAVLQDVKEGEDLVLREEQDEEDSIQEMQNVVEKAQEIIGVLAQVKTQGNHPGSYGYEDYSSLAESFQEVAESMSSFEGVLQEELDVIERVKAFQTQLNRLKQEMEELSQEVEEVKSLEQELKDEEVKAEKIAKKYDDEADWNSIKEEEEETARAIEEMENVIKDKNRIESMLEEDLEELEKIKSDNKQEIQQIQRIVQELNQEDNEIKRIEEAMSRERQGMGLNDATKNYIVPGLETLKETIEILEEETDQIMNRFTNN